MVFTKKGSKIILKNETLRHVQSGVGGEGRAQTYLRNITKRLLDSFKQLIIIIIIKLRMRIRQTLGRGEERVFTMCNLKTEKTENKEWRSNPERETVTSEIRQKKGTFCDTKQNSEVITREVGLRSEHGAEPPCLLYSFQTILSRNKKHFFLNKHFQ